MQDLFWKRKKKIFICLSTESNSTVRSYTIPHHTIPYHRNPDWSFSPACLPACLPALTRDGRNISHNRPASRRTSKEREKSKVKQKAEIHQKAPETHSSHPIPSRPISSPPGSSSSIIVSPVHPSIHPSHGETILLVSSSQSSPVPATTIQPQPSPSLARKMG